MSGFGYNKVDLDCIESVELVGGEISPKTTDNSGGGNRLTKEQKRKSQLVDILDDEFDAFNSLFVDLMGCYYSYGRRNEFLSDKLGVPDYICCENCSRKSKSTNGEPICLETAEAKDGGKVFKIIPNTDSIAHFCPSEYRRFEFPTDCLGEVDDKLLTIAKEGYDEYVKSKRERYGEGPNVTKDISEYIQSKEEYAAMEITNLVGGLYNPRNEDDFRNSALLVSWLLHLEDTLQEDFHNQRAEAYLRAIDSRHKTEKMPGQGGDEFEEAVRKYLKDLGLPMNDRVFNISGSNVNQKEMDIHTEFPWGDKAIFEIFTSRSKDEKSVQLSQYAQLFELAEGVRPVEVMLTNNSLNRQTINSRLLMDLLDADISPQDDLKPPCSIEDGSGRSGVEYLGNAESLSYDKFRPEYQPVVESREKEAELITRLQKRGYEPSLPVYRRGSRYGFIGPTVEIGDGNSKISLTLSSKRENTWVDCNDGSTRNERMYNVNGHEWTMDGRYAWGWCLSAIKDMPVAVMNVTAESQPILNPNLLGTLLKE